MMMMMLAKNGDISEHGAALFEKASHSNSLASPASGGAGLTQVRVSTGLQGR